MMTTFFFKQRYLLSQRRNTQPIQGSVGIGEFQTAGKRQKVVAKTVPSQFGVIVHVVQLNAADTTGHRMHPLGRKVSVVEA